MQFKMYFTLLKKPCNLCSCLNKHIEWYIFPMCPFTFKVLFVLSIKMACE